MIIAVNTQHLLKNRLEGLGWFTYQTLKRMVLNHPEHQFIFIFDRPWDKEFIFANNVTPVKTFLPSRHPILWFWRFQYDIPRILKKHKADLFLSTDGWSTLKKGVKKLTVIHDINFVHQPDKLRWTHRKYFNYFFKRFALDANCLVTVSEFSKKDISTHWNIAPRNIKVIYNGCNDLYKPISESEIFATRKEYSNNKEYFVYIGSLNPRKNIPSMLQAFDQFKKESNRDIKLVLVGAEMWNQKDIATVYSNLEHRNDITFTGRLSNEKLHRILASSLALLLVSYQEGFGIPVIEALNCDVPVICSNTTSLPEVAGKAALFADPYSIESIKNAMNKMASEPDIRNQLIEEGKIQRQKFSWDESAKTLWGHIENCINK